MLKSSRHLRSLLFGAVIALVVGLLGPVNSAVAAPAPVTFTASITGTPAVGETLTAVAGSLSPNNGVTLTYQWQTTDSVDVLGTAQTFVPTSAQLGKQITVAIHGTAANRDPGDSTSAPTGAVQNGFSGTPIVTISDTTPVVDTAITATLSGEDPTPDSVTYQWFLGANAIPSATNAAYTPVATDVGKTLTAKVTAVKAGYLTKTFSSDPTSNVAKGDFSSPPNATVSGTAKVDGLLTASASGEVPTGSGYTYQWNAKLEGASVYTQISGAKSATFAPTPAQEGALITVTATTTKTGYNPVSGTSNPTAAVAPGTFSSAPAVALSTTGPKVGTVLTATASGEVPAAGSYTYQWYRINTSGVKTAIAGAINPDYTVPFGDLQMRLQVKVTAHRDGYLSSSASSVQTSRVNYIALSKTSVVHGQTIEVTAKRLRAGQVYRIFIDGVTVYKGTASSSGTAFRKVTVPASITPGTKKVWVSGYNSSGVRDFQVLTTVIVT